LTGNVSALRRYRPLFYNLGDETGIADLTAFWDFDRSAPALAAMREWLKGRYGDLARLNQEWGAAFSSWEAVAPMMMREAIGRTALGRLQPTGYGANCCAEPVGLSYGTPRTSSSAKTAASATGAARQPSTSAKSAPASARC
jgi:hypothetical protein